MATPVIPVDDEMLDALQRGSLEGNPAYSFLYRHFMTVEERVELARDGVTLADISEGNVEGGIARYKPLCTTINERLGFTLWRIDQF